MKKTKKSGPAIFMYCVIGISIITWIICFTLYYKNIYKISVILWTGITAFTIMYHFWVRIIMGNVSKLFRKYIRGVNMKYEIMLGILFDLLAKKFVKASYLADKYDVDVNQSMGRANERIQASALNAFEDTVDGYDSVSPIQAAMQVANGSYKYALYPVWILNVKWKGQNHTFAMNGQTGKFVGNIPTEDKKAKLIGGLGGAAVGALIYIIINIISSL